MKAGEAIEYLSKEIVKLKAQLAEACTPEYAGLKLKIATLERQFAEAQAENNKLEKANMKLCENVQAHKQEIARLKAMVCPKIDCQTCDIFSSSCYQARKETNETI